ncbi:MAG: DUF92 domain-containing protein [Anaerolineales bacterium]
MANFSTFFLYLSTQTGQLFTGAEQLLGGALLGVLIAWLAYRAGTLSRSGGWAAALMGTIIFGIGGLQWAVLLLTFFVSSSALSRLFGRRKQQFEEKFSKGHRRDAGQVFANGGIAMLIVLLRLWFPNAWWVWAAYAGALAAVNADTWATELGVLNPNPPRLITTGKIVEGGTSGAVSPLGMLAALGGAALLGIFAGALGGSGLLGFAVTLGGVAGSVCDSLLGATIQRISFCPTCNKETERTPLHTCGTPTVPLRGWLWLNNDWVNAACGLCGALVTLALLVLLA